MRALEWTCLVLYLCVLAIVSLPAVAQAQAAPGQTGLGVGAMLSLAALFLALATATLFWSVKWLLDRYRDSINEQFLALGSRFDTLDHDLKQDKDALYQLERKLMDVKADLPLQYVRKEDAVRHEAVYNAKLDAIAAKLDQYAGRQ